MRDKLKRCHDHLGRILTRYRLERQAKKVSRSSGANIDDVLDTDREHFQQMTFLESTPEIDLSRSTPLDQGDLKPPASKKPLLKKMMLKLQYIPRLPNPLKHPLPNNQALVNQRNLKMFLQNVQTCLER